MLSIASKSLLNNVLDESYLFSTLKYILIFFDLTGYPISTVVEITVFVELILDADGPLAEKYVIKNAFVSVGLYCMRANRVI
jgi:hypothetical protein